MSELNKRDEAMSKEAVSSDKTQKKAKTPAKKKDKPHRVRRWLKDMRGEMKKITWPTAKDSLKNVAIVVACVIIVGVCIWVFDFIAREVISALLKLFG